MAISISDCTQAGYYGNGGIAYDTVYIWEFTVTDTVATSKGASYFNPLSPNLRAGDLLEMTCSDGKWLGICSGANPNPNSPSASVDVLVGNVSSF